MDSFENIICGHWIMKIQVQELEMEAKEAKLICVIRSKEFSMFPGAAKEVFKGV